MDSIVDHGANISGPELDTIMNIPTQWIEAELILSCYLPCYFMEVSVGSAHSDNQMFHI